MKSIYYQFYKRFSEGEQYISINNGKIIEEPQYYSWQVREIYNHIQPMVELLKLRCKNLSDTDLYGKTGFVSQLMPYQRAYNNVKHKKEVLAREEVNLLTQMTTIYEDFLRLKGERK